ncbi:hypothetical protein AN944_03126 [Shewanella sp. P1-14-1]|uniref:hypothetical protein n=1 Tax=Shewanella sp. P1-14-1 TaxID=1723761 RepID=UPI0006E58248|nr:hypothetical protein [Shewanella sp. P1-14-1]KPZ69110.1 hypothetical protein AN944_03126 [Shewanella sp. P1-14-1]
MSHKYTSEGYAPQYAQQGDNQSVPQQEQNPQAQPQQAQVPPEMNPYQSHMPPGYGYGMPPNAAYPHMQHPHAHMHPGMHQGMQHNHPHMHPGFNGPHGHPHYHSPYAQHHPMWSQPHMMHPAYYPHPNMPPQSEPDANAEQNDPFMEQAQAMLEQALGEDAGMFKDILGSLGMNDKEFWKGAMIGAAAALLLSNDKVRGKLMDVVSGAGDMLKTGSGKVKETASQTASSVKENVTNSSEIFKDTYSAGKEGFQASVERHYQAPAEEATAETEPAPTEETPVLATQSSDEMKPA